MSRGRHRRSRNPLNSRHLSRLSLALTVGTAGVAVPLVAAGTAQAAPVSVVEKPAVAPQAKAEAETYTVAAGDTLHGIADAEDVEGGWEALYETNKDTIGDNPDLIIPGQELTLAAQADERASADRADRTAERASLTAQTYPDNLDGWIREAMSIMKAHGIPGSYDSIHRNIIRESSGNPNAINNWDINAQNGTPSIGLLQVIKPTFDAYHVAGTPHDQYDPVANIVAACNYAADRYGSIDNVFGPY